MAMLQQQSAITLLAGKPLLRKIRVLVVEDEIARNGIRALIEAEGWEICGERYNGREAIEKTKSLGPDIVILDITPGGIERSAGGPADPGSITPIKE